MHLYGKEGEKKTHICVLNHEHMSTCHLICMFSKSPGGNEGTVSSYMLLSYRRDDNTIVSEAGGWARTGTARVARNGQVQVWATGCINRQVGTGEGRHVV
jgi:hypothetical protein